MDDYCLFRFLMDLEGGKETWDYWSIRYNSPEKARAYLAEQMSYREEDVIYHLTYYAWVQWIAYDQWRGLRKHADEKDGKLMGDIPIGIMAFWWYRMPIDHFDLPNIEAWYERLRDRPAFQQQVLD